MHAYFWFQPLWRVGFHRGVQRTSLCHACKSSNLISSLFCLMTSPHKGTDSLWQVLHSSAARRYCLFCLQPRIILLLDGLQQGHWKEHIKHTVIRKHRSPVAQVPALAPGFSRSDGHRQSHQCHNSSVTILPSSSQLLPVTCKEIKVKCQRKIFLLLAFRDDTGRRSLPPRHQKQLKYFQLKPSPWARGTPNLYNDLYFPKNFL